MAVDLYLMNSMSRWNSHDMCLSVYEYSNLVDTYTQTKEIAEARKEETMMILTYDAEVSPPRKSFSPTQRAKRLLELRFA